MPRSSARTNNLSDIVNAPEENEELFTASPPTPTSTKTCKTKSALERRRAVHLRCEHRRRKEIQDALDALAAELPATYKPRSKNSIIVDSAEYIQQLTISLDCLMQENRQLTGASI
jgi:hypothetical protein